MVDLYQRVIGLENGTIVLTHYDHSALFERDVFDFEGRCTSWPPRLPGQVPSIRNVIFNPPATIIYWIDGTKTVVKCGENDVWDAEKGLAMAVAKKAMGNKGNYNRALKRWLEDRSERSETTRSEMKATGG